MEGARKENLYHPVRIGNTEIAGNLFLAPVAGYSDRAFRAVCREGGADFACTEMVSAEAVVRNSLKTNLLMRPALGETQYAVQLFGGNADTVADAAALVLKDFSPSVIDINAGCPVPKIVKTGAGAALTRDPDRLFRIIAAASAAAGDVPVTVKIRSGWDSCLLSWKEAALAAVEAGAKAVTLHPRTRAQGYEGNADWNLIAELVRIVADTGGGKIPVFGSGDVFSPEAARDMLSNTGCSGVMFARGAMGNPFVFDQTKQLLREGKYEAVSAGARIKSGMKELETLCADKGEAAACREMRKRFCSYVKGAEGAAPLRSRIVEACCIDDYRLLFAPFMET